MEMSYISVYMMKFTILTFTLLILQSLPVPCSINSMCSFKLKGNITNLSCVGVPLSKIPEFPQDYIDEVNIVLSGLEVLDKESFGATKIRTLQLMKNKIITLEPSTFTEMKDVLRSLDLSNNKLQEIPLDVFRNLKNLNWLSLQSNHIVSLETEFPSDWSHLEETLHVLFLGYNDLQYLPQHKPYSLKYLHKLSWLNLDNNKLKTIEPDSLPKSLITLSASNNHITVFSAKDIGNLKNISRIYLRGNRIAKIEDHIFHSPKILDILDLGQNDLTYLTSNPFNATLTVKHLNLDNNQIKTLPTQAFRGLNLKHLYLSSNKLEEIDDKAFDGLEDSLELLDLEKNNLFIVPKALLVLKKLKYLYMCYNKIRVLPDYYFDTFSLTLSLLSLSGNLLTKIPKIALKNCIKLKHLNIGYNTITEVISEDFDNWGQSIETLVLKSNKLTNLYEHTFKNTPNLKNLSLSFNQIQFIHPDCFSDVDTTLEHLEISYCLQMEDFPEDSLKPLNSLLWLSLDNNNFKTIQKTALYSFGNLQYLNLESNRLMKLPKGLFHPNVHKNLQNIRLSFNLLGEIESDTFFSLINLKSLKLNGNNINIVKPNAFSQLPRLDTLILSDNYLDVIHPCAFIDIPNLITLNLQINNLKELSLGIFKNVTNKIQPLSLNISHNQIHSLFTSDPRTELDIKTLDLSHNYILEIPVDFIQHLHRSLRRLYLGNNMISKLDADTLESLNLLEVFTLEYNKISSLHKRAFVGLMNMQILNLSHNLIKQLEVGQFLNLLNLRIINLSFNHIRSLPRDVFRGTKLENINLSSNEFVALPTGALAEIGYTLRYLDISNNNIEHIDSSMFHDIPFLMGLNLCENKLTILPNNAFSSLGRIIRVDICKNRIKANFKELLTYTHSLRHLNFANISLTTTPVLPLPNLVSLNLSFNSLNEIPLLSFEKLKFLRSMSINNNKFETVPSNVWSRVSLLKELDISSNPIKILTKSSFAGLTQLEILNIEDLPLLERLDSGTMANQYILQSLKIQTWPRIEKYRFRLASVLAAIPSLRTLSVNILEKSLTDQLQGGFGPKLQELIITGENLHDINSDALDGIEKISQLVLTIKNTKINKLPYKLLLNLVKISHLTLDLRDNQFKNLNLESLYNNTTNWEILGTKLISGGLILSGNPWECDESVLWLSEWIRRWLCEHFQIHTELFESTSTIQTRGLVKEVTCFDPQTKQIKSIFNMRTENDVLRRDVPGKAKAMILKISFLFLLGSGIPLVFWKFDHYLIYS